MIETTWWAIAGAAFVAALLGIGVGLFFSRRKVTPEDVDQVLAALALVLRSVGGFVSEETWRAIARAAWDSSPFLQGYYEREQWAELVWRYVRRANTEARELHLEALVAHFEGKTEKRIDTPLLM